MTIRETSVLRQCEQDLTSPSHLVESFFFSFGTDLCLSNWIDLHLRTPAQYIMF